MPSGADIRNRTFAALRPEVVLRDDGRYVIYYSLAGEPARASDEDGGAGTSRRPPADQEAWSPDRQPDV